MSERELREKVVRDTGIDFACWLCASSSTTSPKDVIHAPDCPMADDPDVVKVLRIVVNESITYHETLRDAAIRDTLEESYHAGASKALEDLAQWLRDTFNIRLTPDGWERTDE